jgi:hypothetical protein
MLFSRSSTKRPSEAISRGNDCNSSNGDVSATEGRSSEASSSEEDEDKEDDDYDVCSHCGSPKKFSPRKRAHVQDKETVFDMPSSNHEEDSELDEEEKVCTLCGGTPCMWEEYGGSEILDAIKEKYDLSTLHDGYVMEHYATATSFTNNRVRFRAYSAFIFAQYGRLGKKNRVKPPKCAILKIREQFPEPNGNYVGFMESSLANDEQNEDLE